MDAKTRNDIKSLISSKILKKLDDYKAESDYKPFFEAIFSKEIVIQASLIQSLYTTFGMSIYEQMAIILAEGNGFHAEKQYELLGSVNDETELFISRLCDMPIGAQYTKEEEIEKIRNLAKPSSRGEHPDRTVDVFIVDNLGREYYIDITTVKPNKKEARALRRKMLVWAALRFSQNPKANIETLIGIPYNPYFPQEYNRSFVVNNYHMDEVLIQNDLWSLFAGYDVFPELIPIFEEIGRELKEGISNFINQSVQR